jgi:hypothetical protein
MLAAIEAHVISARSVFCFLPQISTSGVIQVLDSPLLVGFPLLLLATLRPTTRLLPFFETGMGMKPTTTERTPPSRKHTFLLQHAGLKRNKHKSRGGKKEERSKRERLFQNSAKQEGNQEPEEQAMQEDIFPMFDRLRTQVQAPAQTAPARWN